MREIPGRHRGPRSGPTDPAARAARADGFADGPGPVPSEAALVFAREWKWPVLPGAGLRVRHQDTTTGHHGPPATTGAECACPDPECALPGAHPFEPGLLAASTDARLVRWWWDNRPTAPVLLATGEGAGPCAVSLPAAAGPVTLAALDLLGKRLGPVVAGPERWAILVAPYDLERLGALLYAKDSVPGALRFHGSGGYLPLPPSTTGAGGVRWERGPLPGSARPWLPDVEAVVDGVVDTLTRTGVSAPEL